MRTLTSLTLTAALVLLPGTGAAQTLARRVAGAPGDALVAFSFPARDGVCGGSHFVRYGYNVSVSRGTYFSNADSESQPCVAGPVRVTLIRAAGQVVGLEVGVGADDSGRDISDLGSVPGAEAAEYLLNLAGTVEGRPGQAALLPAMLAAGGSTTPTLLALVRNRDLARQTRQGAATWLGREAETLPAAQAASIVSALTAIARDETDAPGVRQQVMGVLGRAPQGPGIPALIELAGSNEPWMARTATTALAGSGDPRARAFLRTAARATDRPEGVRAAALRGLGQNQATAQDLALLREIYPTLSSTSEREVVLSAVGQAGGAPNVRWLLGIAAAQDQDESTSSRALRAASQAGATSADLVSLYDAVSNRAPRTTIISLLGDRGDRPATDKLLAIARSDTDVSLRRAAIRQLSNSTDPRVRSALGEIALR